MARAPEVSIEEQCRLLLTGSTGFYEAAESLHMRGEQGPLMHWPALVVNLNYALELSLKAFILLRTRDRNNLRGIGHDLVRGLAMAIDLGFQPPPNAVNLVAVTGPPHMDHSLRYLSGQAIDLPQLNQALAISHAVVVAVAEQLPLAAIDHRAEPA
jgi:hypothetical protein